ncbi:hypothetical protein VOLCADRAFT_93130, partial [Volvox carteri f. nagariensis]
MVSTSEQQAPATKYAADQQRRQNRGGGGNINNGGASNRRPRMYDGPPCEYCGRYGHDEPNCRVLHPQLAPPGWEPPLKALQVLFQANKEQAQQNRERGAAPRQHRAVAVGAVHHDEEDTEDDEEVYVPHRRNANASFNRSTQPPGIASETINEVAASVHATLTHQATPVSFQPMEISNNVYPPPKVSSKPRPAAATLQGSTATAAHQP